MLQTSIGVTVRNFSDRSQLFESVCFYYTEENFSQPPLLVVIPTYGTARQHWSLIQKKPGLGSSWIKEHIPVMLSPAIHTNKSEAYLRHSSLRSYFANNFYRSLLKLRPNAPVTLARGELGRADLDVLINEKVVKFWVSCVCADLNSAINISYHIISNFIYKLGGKNK